MKPRIIYSLLILILFLAAGAFNSCKKTSSQELRDREVEHLTKYVKKYMPDIKPTPSGLYFKELAPGDTAKADIQTGDVVKVFYVGFLIEDNDTLGIIDGEQFDGTGTFESSTSTFINHYEPFTFTVGAGTVIPGWDEAIRLMKDGGEAKWVLPSRIGYSSQPQSGIPAYSPLVFYVRIEKVYRSGDVPDIIRKLSL